MEKNLLVYNASAGSGKTFNLARIFIEELIRQNEKSIDANLKSIMAITFTHKASNEMKERVLRFLELINKNESEDKTAQLLINLISSNLGLSKQEVVQRAGIALELVMENFSQLSISTIDSFSHRIIRSFSKELNLHYDFDVSLDSESWIELAVDRIFDRFGSESEEDKVLSDTLIHFFLSQFEKSSNWNLKWMVKQFALKNLNDELQDNYEKYPELRSFEISKTVQALKDPIDEFTDLLKESGGKAMALIKSKGLTQEDLYYKAKGVYPFFEKAANGEDVFTLPNSYVVKTYEEDKWLAGKPKSEVEDSLVAIKGELAQHLSEIIEAKNDSRPLLLNDLVLRQVHYMALTYFIEKEMLALRKEENILLIGDFNRLIEGVVRNEVVPFIYEKLGERYHHFLLDEFQDTSIKQWHNFIPLFDNAIASNNRNLIVGDGKQAIYRFRDGEVELFSELPEIFKGEGELFALYTKNFKREFERKSLEHNFRSKRAIVEFNNAFFENIKITLGPFSKVYDDIEQQVHRKEEGYVKVEVLDSELLKEEDLYLSRSLESINECIDDGYLPGDIAILTSTKKKLKLLASYLSEKGINVVSDESLVLKNQEGISFIISVLRFILSPTDLQARYALYRSLIVKYDSNSIQELQKIDYSTIPLDEKLKDLKFTLNLEYLRSLSLLALVRELEFIFEMDYSLSAYYSTFLDVIEEYVKYNGNQLDGFIAHWDEIDPSISTPDNEHAVKLLTIHRSKGLEYPIVILPYLDWKKMLTKDFSWFDPPSPIKEILPKVLLKMTNDILTTDLAEGMIMEKQKSLLDNVNVLYVAFTRAMERLYIFSSNKKGVDFISGEINTSLKMMNEGFDLGVIEYGQKERKEESKPKGELKSFSLERTSASSKDKKLKIAYEFLKLRSEKMKKAIDYGKTIHHLFSKVRTRSDLEPVIEDAYRNGLIDEENALALKQKMERILSIKQIEEWFTEDGEKHLERDLINANGEKMRPDRVIIKDGFATIIDYKTGLINEDRLKKYHLQLDGYKKALEAMNYSNVETYLISIDEEKVIQV